MSRFVLFLGLAALLALVAAMPALATPTLYGYSGLFIAPTADVLTNRNFSIALATTDKDDLDHGNWSVTVAAGGQVEAGFVRLRPGGPVNDETVIHGKVLIRPATEGKPAFAAGIFDPTDELDSTVYVVASQETERFLGTARGKEAVLFRAHAGFGGGFIDGLFGGVEVSLGEKLDLIGEWVNNDFNAGGRLHFGPDVTADVWFQNMDTLALGAAYTSNF
jgi:hypothetical protein